MERLPLKYTPKTRNIAVRRRATIVDFCYDGCGIRRWLKAVVAPDLQGLLRFSVRSFSFSAATCAS